MLKLTDFRDIHTDKTITMIGGAVTSIDYRELAKCESSIFLFINWALTISKYFANKYHQLYFATWHTEIFIDNPALWLPELHILMPIYHKNMFNDDGRLKTIEYTPVNIKPFEAYAHTLEGFAKHGDEWITEGLNLISISNTTLLALMFIWYTGCRRIHCVGMHDIGDVPGDRYDPRLNVTTEHKHSGVYMRDLEHFCHVMGIELHYLGDR